MDATVTVNAEVKIAGMGGVWVVQEILNGQARCVRLYTSQRGWFAVASLTVAS